MQQLLNAHDEHPLPPPRHPPESAGSDPFIAVVNARASSNSLFKAPGRATEIPPGHQHYIISNSLSSVDAKFENIYAERQIRKHGGGAFNFSDF
jgi:hypothetical protein